VCGQNLNSQWCGCKKVKTVAPFAIVEAAFKQSRKPLA